MSDTSKDATDEQVEAAYESLSPEVQEALHKIVKESGGHMKFGDLQIETHVRRKIIHAFDGMSSTEDNHMVLKPEVITKLNEIFDDMTHTWLFGS